MSFSFSVSVSLCRRLFSSLARCISVLPRALPTREKERESSSRVSIHDVFHLFGKLDRFIFDCSPEEVLLGFELLSAARRAMVDGSYVLSLLGCANLIELVSARQSDMNGSFECLADR
jgi:hypothetical protein